MAGHISSKPLVPEDFMANAMAMRDMGGKALRMTKGGRLVVKGTSFWGKAAQWLKGRFFPSAERRANLRVLRGLEGALSRSFNVNARAEINAAADEAKKAEDMPRVVIGVVEKFEGLRRQAKVAGEDAAAHFDRYATGGEDSKRLFAQAGKMPQNMEQSRETIGKKFAGFMRYLAGSPSLMKRDAARGDGIPPFTLEGGHFSKEAMDACLATTIAQELTAPKNAPTGKSASPHFSEAQMEWLQGCYANFGVMDAIRS